ncbi:hypothetical protein KQI49_10145 [Virgibacillus sp. MSJ-26]|uniref:hypothetical protein n=1 Tax=Virgibacillus sp. MSJ-26 TaxID=2841522 RepID=UPI001C1127B3|nr:hypothetical protein [Virgibacillus sp. MSJ-26]MBU5467180.1 hypothetical protein [Virgibacillus sp. MSJ-26]
MSLNKVNYMSLVKKQYQFKLKAYLNVFNSLIILQLFSILIAFNPTISHGMSGYSYHGSLDSYTADFSVVFTLLWGFITAFLITTRAYREDDYTFVTNNQTQVWSNSLFLLTISFLSGLTAMLSGSLYRVIFYFAKDTNEIIWHHVTLTDFFIGFMATSMYILLFCSLGYLAGTLVQLHKVFVFILPVLFIGLLIISGNAGKNNFLVNSFLFYFQEGNLILFTLKILVTSGLLFSLSMLLIRNKEVRV